MIVKRLQRGMDSSCAACQVFLIQEIDAINACSDTHTHTCKWSRRFLTRKRKEFVNTFTLVSFCQLPAFYCMVPKLYQKGFAVFLTIIKMSQPLKGAMSFHVTKSLL